MTAIDFSTGTSLPAVGGAPATRLRLTVRGRRVLAFLASIPAVIALSVAIVSAGIPVSCSVKSRSCSCESPQASPCAMIDAAASSICARALSCEPPLSMSAAP